LLALEHPRLAAKLRGYRCRLSVDTVRSSRRVSQKLAPR